MQYQKLTAIFPTKNPRRLPTRANIKTRAAVQAAAPTPAQLLATLPPLELLRKVSVKEAAALAGVSQDTFKRRYGYLLKRVSPRRVVVTLADALTLPPKGDAS
jgi:hypothetical protein